MDKYKVQCMQSFVHGLYVNKYIMCLEQMIIYIYILTKILVHLIKAYYLCCRNFWFDFGQLQYIEPLNFFYNTFKYETKFRYIYQDYSRYLSTFLLVAFMSLELLVRKVQTCPNFWILVLNKFQFYISIILCFLVQNQ